MSLIERVKSLEQKRERQKRRREFREEKQKFLSRLQSYERRREFILIQGICSYETLQSLSEKEVRELWKIALDKYSLSEFQRIEGYL